MRLELMRPSQISEAITNGQPLLVPAGCIENHGPHMAVGHDTIFVYEILLQVAEQIPSVVAPPFWYGPTGYAVSGPEKGTIDVDVDHFGHHVKDVLKAFWEMGFQHIFVFIHHQGLTGPEGLALQRAAMEIAFEKGVEEKGRGWWGDRPPETHDNILDRIRVLPVILPESGVGGDHAGFYETAHLLYLRPDLVDMTALASNAPPWFCTRDTNPSTKATAEEGKKMVEAVVEALVREVLRHLGSPGAPRKE